jgi:predicted nucleic-acid-binding protein
MYLIDTTIFLEILSEQEKADNCINYKSSILPDSFTIEMYQTFTGNIKTVYLVESNSIFSDEIWTDKLF